MAASFTFKIGGLADALNDASNVVGNVSKETMHDILDEWALRSTDIAPLEYGTLRESISTDVKVSKRQVVGEISANAVSVSTDGRSFNYAYYIHEKNAGGKKLRAAGTEKKFLDIPLKQNKERWGEEIENNIKSAIKGAGF